ncbi:hypothetical protein GHT06_017534 [Daphnia sinensis]|uniref:Uncharacterized protein n=1 Tax=Daphnia sinensis TaxID=1820382 RepID=A0AAD5L9B4_9CRUS|nr:hypothetical protein GHT06_017534 [Daphnia sinensis]
MRDTTRSRSAFLRFPILFGSILGIFYMGFQYRKTFMTDIPEKVKEMNKADSDNRGLIKSSIGQINQERSNKNEK